jgi:hypothetical protein
LVYQVGNRSGCRYPGRELITQTAPVNSQAIPHLRKLYADTLVAATTKLPAHSVYRQGVEATIQHRLKILETVKDDEVSKVEQEIGAGQVEELVESAKDELQLVDMMAELKPYVLSFWTPNVLARNLYSISVTFLLMFTLGGSR